MEQQVLRDPQVQLALMESQGHKDPLVLQDRQVQMAQQVLRVPQALQELQVPQEHKGLQV